MGYVLAVVGLGIVWYFQRAGDSSEGGGGDPSTDLPLGGGDPAAPSVPTTGRPLTVFLTPYCPFKAGLSPEQQGIEGGTSDARGNRLYTLENHLADPGSFPYVSCAGDLESVWNYGDTILLPSVSTVAIFKVVDTGSHFHGPIWDVASQGAPPPTSASNPRKVIRSSGPPQAEPIDVCVNDCSSHAGSFGRQQAMVP